MLHVFYKIVPSQKSVTLTLENNLFASAGCVNAQMAQKHALEWKLRINDGYSTMSDGITSSGGGGGGGAFGPLAHVRLYLNLMLSSWRSVFIKLLQQHGYEFCDETKLLGKEAL